jgi:hypothetical protein
MQNQLGELTTLNTDLTGQLLDLTGRNNELLSNLQKLNNQFTLLEQENADLKEQLQEKELRLMNLIEEQKQ